MAGGHQVEKSRYALVMEGFGDVISFGSGQLYTVLLSFRPRRNNLRLVQGQDDLPRVKPLPVLSSCSTTYYLNTTCGSVFNRQVINLNF